MRKSIRTVAEISSVAIGAEIIATSHEEAESCTGCCLIWAADPRRLLSARGGGQVTLINCLAGETVFSTGITGKTTKADTDHEAGNAPAARGWSGSSTHPACGSWEWIPIDLTKSFAELTSWRRCRFKDCGHQSEPGCAVRAAIENGELDPRRFGSYLKLQKEAKYDGLN